MKNLIVLIATLAGAVLLAAVLFFADDSITAREGIAWLRKEKEGDSRLLAIPILLYHNIDGSGPFSIGLDALRDHFRLMREREIRVIPLRELVRRLEQRPAPCGERALGITFDDGYHAMFTKLLPLAREFRYPVTLFVYVDCIRSKATKSLTWDHLRSMERAGIDIQGHSIRHEDLTKYSRKNDPESRRRLYEELYLSKRVMELYLGKEIDLFAFPYGKYDLFLVDMARHAGYRRVFSTDYGSNVITRDNYCLRRQHVKNSYSLAYIESLIR